MGYTIENSLNYLGLTNAKLNWNTSPDELEEISIEKGMAVRTTLGAITVDTGEFTGRSPKDRFIVKDDITKDAVWWGSINIPFDPQDFDNLYNKVIGYLNEREVFVHDAYACADAAYAAYA